MLTTPGIELKPTDIDGIHRVIVKDPSARKELTWDRYVRLKATADATQSIACHTILDAGGFDGALGLFLPQYKIDLIDPVTTGGSVLQIPASENCYDVVAAVDVLEHIEPAKRAQALKEFARVAKSCIILNYPCQDSKSAQEIVLQLINNDFIREHVIWDLPDSNWVLNELARYGFTGKLTPHTSIAVWLGQYVSLNSAPETTKVLNQHLIENYSEEPFSRALYHLLVCMKKGTGTNRQ